MAAAIMAFDYCAFSRKNMCVLHRMRNNLTKFGKDWSNDSELSTVFRNSRCNRHLDRRLQYYLVRIDHVVKKWQLFFEIQDGGSRHIEFGWMCVFRHDSCVLYWICKVLIKFGEGWSNRKEMVVINRNSRWRRQPSWKIHFRLNHQYEKNSIVCNLQSQI